MTLPVNKTKSLIATSNDENAVKTEATKEHNSETRKSVETGKSTETGKSAETAKSVESNKPRKTIRRPILSRKSNDNSTNEGVAKKHTTPVNSEVVSKGSSISPDAVSTATSVSLSTPNTILKAPSEKKLEHSKEKTPTEQNTKNDQKVRTELNVRNEQSSQSEKRKSPVKPKENNNRESDDETTKQREQGGEVGQAEQDEEQSEGSEDTRQNVETAERSEDRETRRNEQVYDASEDKISENNEEETIDEEESLDEEDGNDEISYRSHPPLVSPISLVRNTPPRSPERSPGRTAEGSPRRSPERTLQDLSPNSSEETSEDGTFGGLDLKKYGYTIIMHILAISSPNKTETQYIEAIDKLGHKVYIQLDRENAIPKRNSNRKDKPLSPSKVPVPSVVYRQVNTVDEGYEIPASIKTGALSCCSFETCGIIFPCMDRFCIITRESNGINAKEKNFKISTSEELTGKLKYRRELSPCSEHERLIAFIPYPLISFSDLQEDPEAILRATKNVTQKIRNVLKSGYWTELNDAVDITNTLHDELLNFTDIFKEKMSQILETLPEAEKILQLHYQQQYITEERKFELAKYNVQKRHEFLIVLLEESQKVIQIKKHLFKYINRLRNINQNILNEMKDVDGVIED